MTRRSSRRRKPLMPLNPTDPSQMTAPRSHRPIIEDIHEYLLERSLDMTDFEVVDGALQAVWPELYRDDTLSSFLVTVNVYLALAEQYNFEVQPPYLKWAKMEGLI